MPSVLHVGCGTNPLPAWLDGFSETRMDIDPGCSPDVVASMTDMGDVGPFDALYCSHAVEHLYPHDVKTALGEFLRVLTPGGVAFVIVPDLEDVRATEEPLFLSESGPICGRDLFYGLPRYVAVSEHMAHRSGFVRETLGQALAEAGFDRFEVRRLSGYNLLGAAVKA